MTTEQQANARDDTYSDRVFFEFRIVGGQAFEIGWGPVHVPRVHESVRRHDAVRSSQADWDKKYTVFTTIYFVYNNMEYLFANDYRGVLISGGARNSRTLLTIKYDTSAPRNGVRLFVYVLHARVCVCLCMCVRLGRICNHVVDTDNVIPDGSFRDRTKDCPKM